MVFGLHLLFHTALPRLSLAFPLGELLEFFVYIVVVVFSFVFLLCL